MAKCCLYEKKVDVYTKKKEKKEKGGNIGSCPQVPVVCYCNVIPAEIVDFLPIEDYAINNEYICKCMYFSSN